MKALVRNCGLSLVLFSLFLVFWAGQLATGWSVYNEERSENHEAPLGFSAYLASSHALEATAENWESEFLQMAAFVLLTAFLVQRGSAESRDPDEKSESPKPSPQSPWPVRRGGWVLRLYEHSLSLSLGLLFVVSFALHALGGVGVYNEERLRTGEPPVGVGQFVTTAQFWFESFQNWQSEFLAIGAMVVFTIFLREKDSPESKRVETPHRAHG